MTSRSSKDSLRILGSCSHGYLNAKQCITGSPLNIKTVSSLQKQHQQHVHISFTLAA